jgi:cell division protein ZipA
MFGRGGIEMDWLRISLVILGVILIAGIWFAHRLRSANRRRLDDVNRDDWDGDDAVHIRAVDDEREGEVATGVVGAQNNDDGWGPPPVPKATSDRSWNSLWSRLRKRNPEKNARAAAAKPSDSERASGGKTAGHEARQKPLWEEFDDISAPRVVGRNPSAPEERRDQAMADTGKILLMHVVAPRNRPFAGVAIRAALRRAGLEPGEFSIFHFRDADGALLFSATNMVSPGTLTDADLTDMTTPGISLFVQVHNTPDPHLAFERWLEKTHQLARDLGGSILDAQQSTATNQTLAHMREDMNQWLLRHRPELLRRKH